MKENKKFTSLSITIKSLLKCNKIRVYRASMAKK